MSTATILPLRGADRLPGLSKTDDTGPATTEDQVAALREMVAMLKAEMRAAARSTPSPAGCRARPIDFASALKR
jgi:hypothetical protein